MALVQVTFLTRGFVVFVAVPRADDDPILARFLVSRRRITLAAAACRLALRSEVGRSPCRGIGTVDAYLTMKHRVGLVCRMRDKGEAEVDDHQRVACRGRSDPCRHHVATGSHD